jgi:hypothetical protein
LHQGDGFDYFGAAAGWALVILFDPLVIFGQRPDLCEIFAALLAVKLIGRHLVTISFAADFALCSSPLLRICRSYATAASVEQGLAAQL